MNHLPKPGAPGPPAKPAGGSIHFSPILAEVAQLEKNEVYSRLKTQSEGLSGADAARRLTETGPNVVVKMWLIRKVWI